MSSKKRSTKLKQVSGPGYKGHHVGSRKEAVHKIFDTKGRDKAIDAGLGMKLKEGTLLSWTSVWSRKAKATKAKKSKGRGRKKTPQKKAA